MRFQAASTNLHPSNCIQVQPADPYTDDNYSDKKHYSDNLILRRQFILTGEEERISFVSQEPRVLLINIIRRSGTGGGDLVR